MVTLTERAADRIKYIRDSDWRLFRIRVDGGGCSGFQYVFGFDDHRHEDDAIFEQHGIGFLVDQTSLELLAGSEIDFVTEMIGSYFSVTNPNAQSGCGCGKSFST